MWESRYIVGKYSRHIHVCVCERETDSANTFPYYHIFSLPSGWEQCDRIYGNENMWCVAVCCGVLRYTITIYYHIFSLPSGWACISQHSAKHRNTHTYSFVFPPYHLGGEAHRRASAVDTCVCVCERERERERLYILIYSYFHITV